MKPQGEATNTEFREAIRMLSHVVTNQVGQQTRASQEGAETSRIREIFRINPQIFTGSKTTEDPKKFVEEFNKVVDAMHVDGAKRA